MDFWYDMKTMFGTAGVRHKFSLEFGGVQWLEVGLAIGTYLGKNSSVLIGRDTRQTAELVQYSLMAGLLSCGCEVYVLQGSMESPYVTTSTIAFMTKQLQADAGLQVSASHNTPDYIGIKIWQKSGLGFTPSQEEAIDDIYNRRAFAVVAWSDVIKVKYISNANDIHVKAILDKVHPPSAFTEHKFTVAMDSGNGAAGEIAPMLLRKLGVNVITINAQPDGLFPGRESDPTEENLHTLIRMIKNDPEINLGIAYDGDADRVRFVDREGRLVEGDRILLLFALYYIDKEKRSPFIVTPVNSSMVLEDTLEPRGISVSRTRIGDIPVAIRVQETNARLGGEISGTYTWPEFHLGPDALFSTAKMLSIIGENGPIEDLMYTIPIYRTIYENIETPEEKFATLDDATLEQILTSVLAEQEIETTELTRIDGILARIQGGFVLVRLSGTTPVIRITVECEDAASAERISNGIKEGLIAEIDKL